MARNPATAASWLFGPTRLFGVPQPLTLGASPDWGGIGVDGELAAAEINRRREGRLREYYLDSSRGTARFGGETDKGDGVWNGDF